MKFWEIRDVFLIGGGEAKFLIACGSIWLAAALLKISRSVGDLNYCCDIQSLDCIMCSGSNWSLMPMLLLQDEDETPGSAPPVFTPPDVPTFLLAPQQVIITQPTPIIEQPSPKRM
jgi:hypothetical protein